MRAPKSPPPRRSGARRVLRLALAAGLAVAAAAPWPAAAASSATQASALEQLRRSFTVAGKPVPPEIFRDFGDGDLADSASIRVTIDVRAAIGSNLYFDEIKTDKTWVSQASRHGDLVETTQYRYVGATKNNLLIVIASYGAGGSGIFYTLHVLDAAATQGFDLDGQRYDRLDVTTLRSVPLGDRWDGEVKIDRNTIAITTRPRDPKDRSAETTTRVIPAERP